MSFPLYRQPYILAAGVWIFTVSFFGGLLTDIGPWYLTLKQPDWKPPDWAFGIIWTTIFVCAGFCWSLTWRACNSKQQKTTLAILFLLNGLLNLFWSVLYFRWHRPDWSLIEALFLWISVLAIMISCFKWSKQACLLMSPYLIWVTCAIALNYETIRLNGPFK